MNQNPFLVMRSSGNKTMHMILFLVILSFNACKNKATIPETDSSIKFISLSGGEIVNKTIVLKNGDFAVVGEVNYDAFIAILDENGNVKQYTIVGGIEQDLFKSVIELNNGNLLAVGKTNSISEGASNVLRSDGYVVEFNTSTEAINKKILGSSEFSESLYSVFQGSNGDIILTGYQNSVRVGLFAVKLNSSYGNVWSRNYDIGPWFSYGHSICEAKNGDYVIAGLSSEAGGGVGLRNYNTFIVKLRPTTGVKIFEKIYTQYPRKQISPYFATIPLAIKAVDNGFAWFTFIIEDGNEGKGQYVNLDEDGNVLFEKKYAGLRTFYLTDAIATDDNYLLIGQSSTEAIGTRGFINSQSTIIKIDKQGKEIWQNSTGSSDGVQYGLIAKNKDNKWKVLCGMHNANTEQVKFGWYTLSSNGENNY